MESGNAAKKYVIALDQGTTSSRAMLVDRQGNIVARMQRQFPQVYPQPGWVEHDPADILSSQLGVLTELLLANNVDASQIDSIGITNQRETTLVWDRETGEPLYNAIVWQCRRTAPMIEGVCGDPEVAAHRNRKDGAGSRPVLLGQQDRVDSRPGAGCARTRPGREACIRHGGQLAGVEAYLMGRCTPRT